MHLRSRVLDESFQSSVATRQATSLASALGEGRGRTTILADSQGWQSRAPNVLAVQTSRPTERTEAESASSAEPL